MKTGMRIALSITVAVFIVGIVFAGGAYAWNEAQLQQLKATKSCPSCDLTQANLVGADLTRVNLNGADLNGADLNGAHLQDANLSYTTWTDGSKCKGGSVGECKK